MRVAGFNAHSQKLLCSRFLSSGQWERALAAAQDWLAQEPESARAQQTAGQALIHRKRHDEAEPHLRQVLAVAIKEMRPSPNGWLETARSYATYANRAGLYDDLVAYFEKS